MDRIRQETGCWHSKLLLTLFDLLGDKFQLREGVDADQITPTPQAGLLCLLPALLLSYQPVAVGLEGLPAGLTVYLHL